MIALLLACSSPDPDGVEAPDGPEGVLVVSAEVAGDIRSTAPAAPIGADEPATLLGELRVDEGAYAAVGVSIEARVKRVHAAPGDPVAQSDVLADLESAEVGRARAELLSAQARAAQAKRTVDRKRSLGADLVSPRELDQAESDVAVAEADAQAARAALSALGVGSGTEGGAWFSVRAPLAGTVLARNIRVGEVVDAEHTLFEVADTATLWLVVHASEADALRIHEGDPAEVTVPAMPERTLQGTVARVGQQVDPGSRTIPVRIDVPNADRVLRPGMSAQAGVRLVHAGPGGVAVPLAALQRHDDGWVVFVPRGERQYEVRAVERGRDLGDQVEVTSGLAAGDEVVVDGAFLLKAEAEKHAGGDHDD